MLSLGSAFMPCDTELVMVRLFPHLGHVAMRLESAQHLLRLVEHYNWAISDPQHQQHRWRAFWRTISAIERCMVVMFVRSANSGKFQGLVNVGALPQQLIQCCGDRRLVDVESAVTKEFANLRHWFVQSLVSIDELRFSLWCHRHDVMQEHEQAIEGALRAWWNGSGEYDLDDLLRGSLFEDGAHAGDADDAAMQMEGVVRRVIQEHEEALCFSGAKVSAHSSGAVAFH